jgi:hypothetical protein
MHEINYHSWQNWTQMENLTYFKSVADLTSLQGIAVLNSGMYNFYVHFHLTVQNPLLL